MQAKGRFGITAEEHRDLFAMANEYPIAHYASANLDFSKGIARVLNTKYGIRKDWNVVSSDWQYPKLNVVNEMV